MAFVESVEYLEISVGASDTTKSVNLGKSQTENKCVPFMTCGQVAGQTSNFDQIYLDCYMETGKVTVQRTTSGGTMTVGITVVEFGSDCNVQSSAFSMADTEGSDTVNITSVTQSKAAFVTNYRTNGIGNTAWGHGCVRAKFNSDSQLIFERSTTAGAIDGHFYLFECVNNEFSVQAITDHIIAASQTAKTTDITAVTMNKTFLISTFKTSGTNDDVENYACGVRLSNTSQLYSVRYYAKNESVDTHVFVVSFAAGGTQTVQRGTFDYSATDVSATDTISEVFSAAAMPWNASRQGMVASEGDTAVAVENAWNIVKLASTTEVQGFKDSGEIGVGEWEVIEWDALNYIIEGKTYDKNGAILSGCDLLLAKDNQDDTCTVQDYTTSDANGDYQFTYVGDNDAQYLVYAWRDDSPHVMDCTDHVLLPKETPDMNYNLYLRSDVDKGEVSPDKDLRLWSYADRIPGDLDFTGIGTMIYNYRQRRV